ncbi:hypothetical protein FXO38_22036 [Capsicum annuum]|nr:hypothetical protein FXO38_22036 [Capsicum annuum]
MHVVVKGNILRFMIYEFALITEFKCYGNIDDFSYEDSSPSRLMRRYFLQSTNGVDKEALIECFLKGNFDTIEDSLQMTILYFIHTFIYSQLNASPVLFFNFKMVEDGKYEFFSCCKVAFSRLMPHLGKNFLWRSNFIGWVASLRKEQLVKADLDSLKLEIKTCVKAYMDLKFNNLERVMNEKFSKVLKSLQLKNQNVEKEDIVKHIPKEVEYSDDVADGVDVAVPSNADNLQKDSDKEVEIDGSKLNQALAPVKYGEHDESDDGIEQMEDMVVEEMKPLDTIVPVQVNDMTLTVYIDKKLPIQDAFAWTDEVAQTKISLINYIRGLSTPAAAATTSLNLASAFNPVIIHCTFEF